MSNASRLDTLSPLKRALLALEEMRTKLDDYEQALTEPIAIIGMSCRYPGKVDSPTSYWELLKNGTDAISEVPRDRWDINRLYDPNPDAPGKMYMRWAGFLDQVDKFDPAFFGISPREAAQMDPQQRLVLETAWEAFDDAGISNKLAGSLTGVYIGTYVNDYSEFVTHNLAAIDVYTGMGIGAGSIAGRVSYAFDLRGPCLVANTACSSSLVTVHLASQALRKKECDVAIAGGVNVMITPFMHILLSRMRALSPDGRCKTFDASADGYARGEGCGLLVLKRLSDALADNDNILALVRGSAINQDGRSTGFTAPNVLAQQSVIRQALATANVEPEEITYVEAHGTGTPLGDPIEIEGLKAIYGKPRANGEVCAVGSVKTNFGHLETAAGVAGIMKIILALRHQAIPPHLHLRTLNPNISLKNTPFVIPTELRPWPAGEKLRFAAISAFAISGTNAHMIISEAPRPQPAEAETVPPEISIGSAEPLQLLPLSARSSEALTAVARNYHNFLVNGEGAELALADICYTASLRRPHHDYRLAVASSSRAMLIEQLAAFANGERRAGVAVGQKSQQPHKLVFVCSGQGPQWWGMGRELLAAEPVFRAVIEECDRLLSGYASWSLLTELQANEADSRLSETEIAQPAIFAIQVALAALWRARGIEPDAIVGHSMGEVAAAHLSGALTLEDALHTIYHRGRLMQRTTGQGKTAAVEMPLAEAAKALEGYEDRVSVAGHNSPTSIVLSGEPAALGAIVARLEREQIFARFLRVNYAFHSPQMQPLLGELAAALKNISPRASKIPLYSTVTGQIHPGAELNASYWCRNLRETVRFASAIDSLISDGFTVFLELSPHPVLAGPMKQCLSARNEAGQVLASLRRGEPERLALLSTMGALYTCNYPLDWRKLHAHERRPVQLPCYAWQRKRYWMESAEIAYTPYGVARTEHQPDSREWLYEQHWQPEPLPAPAAKEPGNWLIFTNSGAAGEALAARLAASGAQVTKVFPANYYERLSASEYQLNASEPGDFDQLINATIANGQSWRGVIHMASFTATPPLSLAAIDHAQPLLSASLLHLTQALARCQAEAKPRLWLLTNAAQQVNNSQLANPAASSLWGLAKVIALELPELRCARIDLSADISETELDATVSELLADSSEDQIAVRGSQRYLARLARYQPDNKQLQPRADASYLITGAMGGLGLLSAEWLVTEGARNLLLIGRRAPDEQAAARIEKLRAAGAQVLTAQADVANEAELKAALDQLRTQLPALRGVIHAAGTLDDGILLQLNYQRFARVMAAKVAGSWNLHSLTANEGLEFFICYSSAASLLGSPGQGNYAAANAFIDGLCHYRRAQGLAALSINWGPWLETGMAAAAANRGESMATRGVASIPPNVGFQLLKQLSGQRAAQVGVIALDFPRFAQAAPQIARTPFFALLRSTDEASASADATEQATLTRGDLLAAEPAAQHQLTLDYLHRVVAKSTGIAAADLDTATPLNRIGIDSLMAVEMKNQVELDLGVNLPIILFLQDNSIASIAEQVRKRLGEEPSANMRPQAATRTEKAPLPSLPTAPVSAPSVAVVTAKAAEAPAYTNTPWVIFPRPNPAARLRLFCFPFAGGGPAVFAGWPASLRADIEVCAIQLPGRGARLGEKPFTHIDELLAELPAALLPLLDRPFALFGHCLGAIEMFEVARKLERDYRKRAVHIFASGAAAPHLYMAGQFHQLSTEKFTAILRFINFANTEALLQNDELRELVMPTVQADFQAASNYQHTPQPPTDVPITAFGGWEDVFAPPNSVEAWREHTSGAFSAIIYPGGHYFLEPERNSLLEQINRLTTPHLDAAPATAVTISEPTAPTPVADRWLVYPQPNPDAKLRLFCFPYAGGGPATYQDWPAQLGREIELCSIQLPGRGARARELPLTEITELTAALVPALRSHLTKPFAFFGHDLGAILMFEVARAIGREAGLVPLHLFVSSAIAPQLYYFAPIHMLPQQRFFDTISAFDFPYVREDERAQLLPSLRADFAAMANYRYQPGPPLACPITAVLADRDILAPHNGIEAWRAQTSVGFNKQLLAGTHYFLNDEPTPLLRLIGASLATAAQPEGFPDGPQ